MLLGEGKNSRKSGVNGNDVNKDKENQIEKTCEQAISGVKDFESVRLLEFTEDGVYLTVYPPERNGISLTFADLEEEIKALSLQEIDWENVKRAIEAKYERIKIAPTQEVLKKDGEVVVKISQDEMEATVTVYPPVGGNPVNREMVLQSLEKAGVVSGIEPTSIDQAIKLANVSEPVVVARGKPSINGKDAQISYYFPIEDPQLKPRELENGKVDYYDLNLVYNVEGGQVLAIKTPATQGEFGFTVTGKALSPQHGKDCLFLAGKNTELRDGGLTVIASIRGHVVLQGNKIHVLPVYEVPGDVDFSTGNIDFVGSIQIRGGVKFGFTVRAEGDVEIRETIEGGSVVAGGNIIVKEGIRGLGKGSVVAKSIIYAKFIENARVQAGQDVVIGEAIMHSDVSAGGKIIIDGRKGLLVGGICRAGEDIEAKIIGSNLATVTELEVGVNPELRVAYNQICSKRGEIETHLDKVEKALNLLRSLKAEEKELPQDKKVLLIKLTRTQFQLKQELEKFSEEENKLIDILSGLEEGKVKVKNLLHSGVVIRIGQFTYYVRDEMQYVTISQERGEIKILPYS